MVVIVWRRRDRRARRVLSNATIHRGADFSRCRLVAMDLRGKDLQEANLEWADLTESDLRGCKLGRANLHGAYLTGAQLDGADLERARLDGTYLLMTDFGNARLVGTTFAGAVWDQGTTWPAGFTPPKADVGMWHGHRD